VNDNKNMILAVVQSTGAPAASGAKLSGPTPAVPSLSELSITMAP